MAVTATPVFVQTPSVGVLQMAANTNFQTVVTAGANGSKVVSVMVASSDARVLQLAITRSAVNYILGSYSVTANSGIDGTVSAVDLLRGGPSGLIPGLPVDNDGQPYLFLKSGDTLTVKATVAPSGSTTVNVVAVYGDF